MAIGTYAELGTAIQTWFMGRTDLSANTDEIIALAEGYLNTKLRCRQMETSEDLTPDVDGVCTLPDDYLEYKRVVELASIRRRLDYITEDAADEIYPTRAAGLACHFTLSGESLIALPISANDIQLTYYQKVPALSGSATTNWLLSAHPGLYLHTCLFYAAELVRDDAIQATEAALIERFLDNIHALDTRAKFGNAGVTLRGPAP